MKTSRYVSKLNDHNLVKDPESGNLACTLTENTDIRGYGTVMLDTQIPLSKIREFSVCVAYMTKPSVKATFSTGYLEHDNDGAIISDVGRLMVFYGIYDAVYEDPTDSLQVRHI